MKKAVVIPSLIFFLCASVYPLRYGAEFSVISQPSFALSLRISDVLELKPQLGFRFAEDNSAFLISTDVNYYLTEINKLQHYTGGGMGLSVVSDNTRVLLNGHYGLRYDVNEVISIFGEAGVQMAFNDFVLTTFMGGAGLTFYFL